MNAIEQLQKDTGRNTVFIAVVLGLLYGFFFLPASVLDLFQARFHPVAGILAGLSFSGVIAGIGALLVAAQDVLATCEFKAAKFFRQQYPSVLIRRHYNVSQGQADFLWFGLFNPWDQPGHPRHTFYWFTVQRSHACRFIFHARWLLIFFCVLATLTWAFNLYALYLLNTAPAWLCRFHWLIQPHPVHEPLALHYARAVLLTVSATAVLVLFFSNRIHGTRDVEGKSESGPTGCWNLWKEINEINKEWIEEAVFSRAPTYADAVLLLQNPAWRAAHGYLPSRHSTVPGAANT